jgi:hypothetical protein
VDAGFLCDKVAERVAVPRDTIKWTFCIILSLSADSTYHSITRCQVVDGETASRFGGQMRKYEGLFSSLRVRVRE